MLRTLLTNPYLITAWLILALLSLAILIIDLQQNNKQMHSLMKWVWLFTCSTQAHWVSLSISTPVEPRSLTTHSGDALFARSVTAIQAVERAK